MKTTGHWVYFEVYGKRMKYFSKNSTTQAEAVENVHELVKKATKIVSVRKSSYVFSEETKKKVKETIDSVHKSVDKIFEDFNTVFDNLFKKEKPKK